MDLKALIFDVDGTLAETEELHRRAFNDAFASLGLAWSWDRALYGELLAVTGGKERILHYVARHHPATAVQIQAQVPEIHRLKTRNYTALVQAGAVGLRPGVARLIAEAKQAGLRLAVATTTSRPNVAALLRSAFPLSGETIFDVIAAGDEVGRKKPWPDIYALALRQLGLPPTACIAIEDSGNGVRAARAAGVPVVVTPSVYTQQDDVAGALSVVSDLAEPGAGHRWISGARWDHDTVTLDGLRRWLRGRPDNAWAELAAAAMHTPAPLSAAYPGNWPIWSGQRGHQRRQAPVDVAAGHKEIAALQQAFGNRSRRSRRFRLTVLDHGRIAKRENFS